MIILFEQETRAEAMARLGPMSPPEFQDYFQIKLNKLDELRELIFGTSCLVELARRWNLPLPSDRKKSKRKKNKTSTKI